ncbi:hypothetical protein VXQ18_09220, partial [Brucella abortus]|nr:hypothetical protein [Brucella abortus]
ERDESRTWHESLCKAFPSKKCEAVFCAGYCIKQMVRAASDDSVKTETAPIVVWKEWNEHPNGTISSAQRNWRSRA